MAEPSPRRWGNPDYVNPPGPPDIACSLPRYLGCGFRIVVGCVACWNRSRSDAQVARKPSRQCPSLPRTYW